MSHPGLKFLLSARPSGGFDPTSISGLFQWIDASDESSITESGGAVSQIDDLSGNGRHYTQGTGSLQPVTGVESLNGLNVLDFASSDRMSWSLSSASRADPWTVFVVCRTITENRVNISLGSNNGFAPTTKGQFGAGYGFLIGGVAWAGSGGGALNEWLIHTSTHSYSGSTATTKAYKNGTLTHTYTGSMVEMSGAFWLGGDVAGSHTDSQIAELLIYKAALSTDDIAAVEDYLTTKWGL